MARPRVYVTRRIPEEGLNFLRETCDVEVNPHDRPLSRDELLEKVQGRDGVLCLLTDRIDAAVYEAASAVKGFANYAVGYDNIDVPEATRRGIPVSNTPGVLTDATAEMAWSLLFAVGRRVVASDAHMRSGEWQGWGPLQFVGCDVTGATLGIIGSGRIGTAMALKSRGFNMEVLYTDAYPNTTLEDSLGARKVDLEELLSQSDFVSVHCPLMPETTHLLGKEQFALMKKSACLINTARGPIIDEVALVKALENHEIFGAGLDVYEFEPQMAEGLSKLANVVVTPHTASPTRSSRTGMALKAATNLLTMIRGEQAPDCINPQVYETAKC